VLVAFKDNLIKLGKAFAILKNFIYLQNCTKNVINFKAI